MLDLIDDVAAGAERFVAMARADAHPHGHLAERRSPTRWTQAACSTPKRADGLGDDALAFLDRQRLEGLVLQVPHLLAFVVVAHPAFERGVAAAGRISEPARVRLRRRWVSLAKLKDCIAGLGRSAAGDRRNEHDAIAFGERLRPVAEFRVDGDAQHLGARARTDGGAAAPRRARAACARRSRASLRCARPARAGARSTAL